MDFARLDQTLRESIADYALDNEEKFELRELGGSVGADRVRYLRNRAFDMTRELMLAEPPRTLDALRWLEQVVKTLDVVAAAPTVVSSAYFAPGDACLRKLRELCRGAKRSVDVCVYTISDDRRVSPCRRIRHAVLRHLLERCWTCLKNDEVRVSGQRKHG